MSPFEVPEGPYSIEKIMESIRTQVVDPQNAASAPATESSGGSNGPAPARPIVSDGGPASRLLAQLELLRQRQSLDTGYRIKSHRPLVGPVLDFLKRVIHWGSRPYTDAVRTRQEAFNEAALQALREAAVQIEGNVRALDDHQAYIQSFMDAIHDLQAMGSDHAERMNGLVGNIEELSGLMRQQDDSIQRHEKMLAEHHGNISNQECRLKEHRNQLRSHEHRINTQQDRLDLSVRQLKDLLGRYDMGALSGMATKEQRLEALDKTRGTYEDIRCRQYPYLKFFENAPGQVLDIGCGRGEMLHMLRIHGIECWGAETDPVMAEICRDNGDHVVDKDALGALEGIDEGKLGGVFAAQVIEHFFPGDLVRFIALARRKLAPGGVVILETLNPASLGVLAKSYWRDLEHKQMIHPEYLKGMLELAGFVEVELQYLSPFDERDKLPELPAAAELGISEEAREALRQRQEKLNDLLFGMQDYFVVARVARAEGA